MRQDLYGGKRKKRRDDSLGRGVFFNIEDYAGPVRRILILVIDLTVLMLLWSALLLIAVVLFPRSIEASTIALLIQMVACFLYLTVLKRSTVRTVGYRICGVKIVATTGKKPTLLAMTFRLLMWIFGPFNLLIDLVWLGPDTERQTLRDCYAGTYVVRDSAEPIGEAPIHIARYCGAGFTLMYPRVVRPKEESQGDH